MYRWRVKGFGALLLGLDEYSGGRNDFYV